MASKGSRPTPQDELFRNQVPITIQRDLFIDVPCLAEQRFIGNVFESFSKKIELNRKTSETLEGMTKALFRSWFIDFDPVKEKLAGRSDGLPGKISELFPDSFEDSELGEIPSGWSISSIKDQSSYLSRGISPNTATTAKAWLSSTKNV